MRRPFSLAGTGLSCSGLLTGLLLVTAVSASTSTDPSSTANANANTRDLTPGSQGWSSVFWRGSLAQRDPSSPGMQQRHTQRQDQDQDQDQKHSLFREQVTPALIPRRSTGASELDTPPQSGPNRHSYRESDEGSGSPAFRAHAARQLATRKAVIRSPPPPPNPPPPPYPPWNLPDVSPGWVAIHDRYSSIMASGTPRDVILFGDSITEAWSEKNRGKIFRMYQGVSQVFSGLRRDVRTFILNFGISGDRVANVQWRMQNGELPLTTAVKVVVLCVGINDMKKDLRQPAAVAQDILNLASIILKRPNTKLIVGAILPERFGAKGWVPNSRSSAVNAVLRSAVPGLAAKRSTFMDCSSLFLSTNGNLIPSLYFTDKLHLSLKGYKVLRPCFARAIKAALA